MGGRSARVLVAAASIVALAGCTAPTASPAPPAGTPGSAQTAAPSATPTAAPLVKTNLRLSFKAHGHNAPYFLALEKGFKPLVEEGIAHILDGSTSIAEVARSVDLTQRFR